MRLMEAEFCVDALNEAIEKYGCPEIFNTDQGRQFTIESFTKRIKAKPYWYQYGWPWPFFRQHIH